MNSLGCTCFLSFYYRLPERLDDVHTVQGSRPPKVRRTASQALAIAMSPPPPGQQVPLASLSLPSPSRRVGSAFFSQASEPGPSGTSGGRAIDVALAVSEEEDVFLVSGPSGGTRTPSKEPAAPKKTLFLSMEEDEDDELPPLGGKLVASPSDPDTLRVVYGEGSPIAPVRSDVSPKTPIRQTVASAFSSPLTSPPASGPSTPPAVVQPVTLTHGMSFPFSLNIFLMIGISSSSLVSFCFNPARPLNSCCDSQA